MRPCPFRIDRAATLAAALGLLASHALAAEEATLELFHGPNEATGLVLQGLRAELDGKELAVKIPSAGADPEVPIYRGTIAPGVHNLQVEVDYAGGPSVFSYVEGYHFRMRGQLEVKAGPGEVVSVQSRVRSRSDMTVQWQDRYFLSLSGAPRRATEPLEAQAPPPPPPVAVGPPAAAPPPLPAPAEAPATPARCVLDPVHFAFRKARLDAEATAALDRYSECLSGTRTSVLLEGYCDQRGGVEYNLRLGERRAAATAQYLHQKGIDSRRISVRSFGKSKPLCTEASEDCYARNRRVEAVSER